MLLSLFLIASLSEVPGQHMNSFTQVGFNTEEEREKEKLRNKKKRQDNLPQLNGLFFPHINKSDPNFIMFVLLSMDFD